MPLSLYDAAVPSMVQILAAGQIWLDKAEASGLAENEIAGACLIDDMLPFAYQIKSMAAHSQGAIEGLRAGVFSPDMTEPSNTFAGMRAKLVDAQNFLETLAPEELEGFVAQDMRFEFKDFAIPFTGANFLLSFSQPNFFFHATTAYGILRMKGVAVGKRDFLGPLRVKQG